MGSGRRQSLQTWTWLQPILRDSFRHSSRKIRPSSDCTASQPHLFLNAFLTGDMDVLIACLNLARSVNGNRAFLAVAGRDSSCIEVADWISFFGSSAMLKRLSLPYQGAEAIGRLSKAFQLLGLLTAGPRLELGETRPERRAQRRNSAGRVNGATVVWKKYVQHEHGDDFPPVIFADFEMAEEQIANA